jgi:hypothetical protein
MATPRTTSSAPSPQVGLQVSRSRAHPDTVAASGRSRPGANVRGRVCHAQNTLRHTPAATVGSSE